MSKKITESPRISDVILLEIETPDGDGCFVSDPYKVDSLIVYYVERNFVDSSYGQYDQLVQNQDLVDELTEAQKEFCDNPTDENKASLEAIRNELQNSSKTFTWYYKDRVPVKVIGTSDFPAWFSTDIDNSPLVKVEEDEEGNPVYGKFTYEWHPDGAVREGQYFACWTWSPLLAGDKLSAHIPFNLLGDPKINTSIPTHLTPDDKYEILLERYLPEVYKTTLSDDDQTPILTQKLNNSIGDGFKFVEDFANQVIDLLDANVLHESMLNYLGNFFNLRLKSNDPTLWRRQIKEAMPLFKKKGTLSGLQEAFAQSGMTLNSFTQFWQIVSKYTYQESFLASNSLDFKLTKDNIILPIDNDNFGVWIRREGETEYTQYSKDYVSFSIDENSVVTMSWIGDNLSAYPVSLYENDIIRVLYQFKDVPSPTEQQYEEYIRSLPYADTRDETDQLYPVKNWNLHLIDSSDPLFDVLIPVKNSYHDAVIFGFIRTEFPYGENIYNMDSYNGSTRPSKDPCNIDKKFLDTCGSCLSSTFSVDISMEELSNDRILEAKDVLDEYTPFHAQLYTITFSGDIVDFVQPPTEKIDVLITFVHQENHLSGQANPYFNRHMEGGLGEWIINRSDLTDQLTVASKASCIVYNSNVCLVAPNVFLKSLGIRREGEHLMKVFSPSTNAGLYSLKNIDKQTAEVTPIDPSAFTEPIDESQFTFDLVNINYTSSIASISQDNACFLDDDEVSFEALGVKTLWDVDHTPDYTGGSWKVLIPAYSATAYEIYDISGGILQLVNDGSLPTSDVSGISYTLLDDNDDTISSSDVGDLSIEKRGFVELNDSLLVIEEIAKIGYLLHYDNVDYKIVKFSELDFWISEYEDGDVAGASIEIRKKLLSEAVGNFGYQGLNIITPPDHEVEFGIVNGNNPPTDVTDDNNFKENYMFFIDEEYFKITEWDGTYARLSGRSHNWKTLDAGGTTISYKLVHFPKKQVSVQFTLFDHLDRDGRDPVIKEVNTEDVIEALSLGSQSGIQDNISTNESVEFIIQTRNGDMQEGVL